METVTIKHNGEEYNIDSATLEKCKVVKPTWDRMEVLGGEWIPKMGEAYYTVSDSAVCTWSFKRMDSRHGLTPYEECTQQFFPTRELAEEYLTIGEGKWLPKKGDGYCNIDSPQLWHSYIDFLYDGCERFPSPKQRDEYISKHKKQERPLAGKEAIIDGVTYKLQ